MVRGCAKIVTVPSGGSGPGGTTPPPGGGPAPTSADSLTLDSATGLQCGSELPTCTYTMSGGGADALLGTVSGGGGVTTLGGSLTTSGENWSALGLYGCNADGYLRVTIGSKQLDVPVDCTTSWLGHACGPGPLPLGARSPRRRRRERRPLKKNPHFAWSLWPRRGESLQDRP